MRSFGPNTDGLHFEGPANDIAITGCEFGTGDDAIALNCRKVGRYIECNCQQLQVPKSYSNAT